MTRRTLSDTSKMPRPFVIGVDFGTLSARGVLADARNGRAVAAGSADYANGVMSERLGSTRLKAHSALQNPADYLRALEQVIATLLHDGKVRGEDISAIGTDFTSCTVLPVKADGTPLCLDKKFSNNPHAWVKLWKHHASQPEADHINEIARKRREEFIRSYGGRYSSEWFFSKVLETVREAPEVYRAAGFFTEACDWIVWQLTGVQTRNLSAAGFKGMRVQPQGNSWVYPSPEFYSQLHPELKNVVAEKLGGPVVQLGSRVGGLAPAMAARLNLPAGMAVAAGNIDAHAAVPACGVSHSGTLVMMMGTSTCHLLITDSREEVEGICGVVQDGVIPGAWGYEAGQAGVGDLFAWYVDQGVPASVTAEADRLGQSVHDLLSTQAGKMRPGENGLLALDWWSGNRSILVDSELTGLLIGLTTHTRPHEIYRALIEATAFGTRKIVDAFTAKGLPVNELVASGGLAQKNPVLMQIYADVLQRPITVAQSEQSSAFGAALWATVAGGLHPNIHEAVSHMVKPSKKVYCPNRPLKKTYDQLYDLYTKLHDAFGRSPNSVMKTLRHLQKDATQ